MITYSFTFFFTNFGLIPPHLAVPAEIFPVQIRSTCLGIYAAAGKAGSLVDAFGFVHAVDRIGVKKTLITLGVTNFFGIVFIFLVPESKGHSLEEISGEHEEDNAAELRTVPV